MNTKTDTKRRVLVVEDALPVQEALCNVLETDGFEVRGCGDAASVMEAVSKKNFQIIILDYRLPDTNGADLARRLRARFPGSLIIGVSTEEKASVFLASGADVFLLKPYRYAELVGLFDSHPSIAG